MKVLLISPYFFEPHRWMMSAYKTALNLSKTMEVVVLTTGQPSFEQFNPKLRVYRMWDIFLPDPINYSIIPGLIPHLERVIYREKPDIFLVNKHMFFTVLAVYWLKLRGKKVICATDTFPGLNWFSKSSLVNLVMRIYSRLIGIPALKVADRVVLFHEGLKPIGERLRLNFSIIHNGIDVDRIQLAQPSKILPDNKINAIYVGRLESVKGYLDLLAAARQITKQNSKINFYLVGNTAGKEGLVKEYQSSQIKFLGFRRDIPSLLKQSDIFILPSYSEGLPNALMEAMAAGVAPIASNVGGIKTLIKSGYNGILFEPGNVHQLVEAIEFLASDSRLRAKFARLSQEKIVKEYNWQAIATEYQELFREVANA